MEIEYTHCWFEDNAKDIKSWFDPETYNWDKGSHYLCAFFFDKFDWNRGSYALVEDCWNWRHIWLQDWRGRDVWFNRFRGNYGFLPVVKV